MKYIKILVIILLFLKTSFLNGQKIFHKSIKEISLSANTSSTGITPFWLRSNTFGEIPYNSNVFIIRSSISKDYDSTYSSKRKLNKFDLGYGASFVTALGKKNQIIVPQIFIKVRYKSLELSVGRKKEFIGLTDSTLTSGSFVYSNNALPIPKVQFAIPNYTALTRNGLISVKGNFSLGTLGNQYYVKNQFFHHKSLYGKLGKNNWKINLFAGFTHQIQLGGKLNNITKLNSIVGTDLPNSAKDFIFAFTGLSLGGSENNGSFTADEYTSYDLTNRIGNHFGNIDIGGKFNFNQVKINFYRQSIYDDGSLFYLNNISDGLTGLSFKFQNSKHNFSINKLVVEYFNSSSQGGPIPPGHEVNPQTRGADNYFNHGQFLDGWSYNNTSIGSPFILSHKNIKKGFPEYKFSNFSDKEVYFFTNNNRIKAIFLGIDITLLDISILLKNSLSYNLGTYQFPFEKNIFQYSGGFSAIKNYKSKKISLNFGYDNNGILQKNMGIMVEASKSF